MLSLHFFNINFVNTVKLGIKELLNKEQLGNSEPFPVINMPVCLTNSEEIGFSYNCVTTKKFLITKFDCTKL